MILSLLSRLPGPFKSIAERLDRTPIDTVESMFLFARTRASFVAQTSLFGYLKARMGTQFREYFTDDVFSQAIQDSSVKVFVSCLSDLTVHVVATVAEAERLAPQEAEAMARLCFDEGMRGGLVDIDAGKIPADAHERFDQRMRETDWSADLTRHAPVVDEFKKLDRKIVATSIGNKWREVRIAFQDRVVPESIAFDWRSDSGY